MALGDYTKTEWVNGSAPGISAPRLLNIEDKIEELDTAAAAYIITVPYGGTTTNNGNAYSIASPAIAGLVAGMAISAKINADSTGAATLNWYGTGAKSILKANGSAVTNLKNGGIYTFRYDGANFILQGEGASGTAIASDLLSGKTASTDAGDITGTMNDNGTVNITPGTSNQTIATGKHSGSGVVYGDADLVSANIKSGIAIFGVNGNVNVVDTSAGDAVAANILSGKKAFVDGALVTGTIASKGAATITPGTSDQTIAAGQYLSGIQTISGDADLVAENIKSGKTIFGVAGNPNVVDTSAGDAAAGNILSGKIAFVDGSQIIGSMINRGAVIITPSTSNQAIAVGYHNGSGYVAGDADLVASNILYTANIFGVAGSAVPRQVASGTKVVAAASTQYTVSGLAFSPALVVIYMPWYNYQKVVGIGSLGDFQPTYRWRYWDSNASIDSVLTISGPSFSFYTYNSFYDSASYTYRWLALA